MPAYQSSLSSRDVCTEEGTGKKIGAPPKNVINSSLTRESPLPCGKAKGNMRRRYQPFCPGSRDALSWAIPRWKSSRVAMCGGGGTTKQIHYIFGPPCSNVFKVHKNKLFLLVESQQFEAHAKKLHPVSKLETALHSIFIYVKKIKNTKQIQYVLET